MGLFLFLGYLFLEILFSYFSMELFSPVGFFGEVIFTAIAGIWIIKDFSFAMIDYVKELLVGELTPEEVFSIGIFKFIGAVLLIIPGAFSDLLGLIMVIDWSAQLFARFFLISRFPSKSSNPKMEKENEIIDVEIVEDSLSNGKNTPLNR